MRQLVPLAEALADAEVFTDGDWVESKDQDPDGDVRLTQLADVGDGYWINKSARFLTSEKAKQLRCTHLNAGDLLVARMPDPLGRCCIFPGDSMPCVTVVDVCVIRPNPQKIDNEYLMHAINSPHGRQRIAKHITGTTRQRISRKNLGKIQIPLPPLAEQKRIAGILDAADALRAKRRDSLTQLDTLLQSTFLDMFGDPVTNPMGWKVVTLGDVLSVKGGYAFKSADYLEDRFGVPLIRIGDVNRCEFVRQKLAQLPADYLDKFEKFVVRNGSILMSLTGTVGKDDYGNAVTLQGDTDRYLLNQRVAELIPRASLAADYLHGVLSHERVKRILTGRSRGIRQANISNNDIKQLQVQLPPLYLQRRFTTIVKSVEQQKSRLHTHLVELDTLFASLQQRAFDGELSA